MAKGATYQIIKFNCRYTLVYAIDDLQSDSSGINMIRVQAITQSRDTSCDLIELNAFLAPICRGGISKEMLQTKREKRTALVDKHGGVDIFNTFGEDGRNFDC